MRRRLLTMFIAMLVIAIMSFPSPRKWGTRESIAYAADKGAAPVSSPVIPAEAGIHSIDSRLHGNDITLWQRICDFFVTPAYAADKGNPPVAHWRFDEGDPIPSSSASYGASGATLCLSTWCHAPFSLRVALTGAWHQFTEWLCPSVYAADKGNPPVAHWRFDEGGGPTAYDDSGNNNDGTMTPGTLGTNTAAGQMWTRQGKIGGAGEFDGTDDYVTVSDDSSLDMGSGEDFTAVAWINVKEATSNHVIIEKTYKTLLSQDF